MPIEINPNRINIASGSAGKIKERPHSPAALTHNPVVPRRAHVNVMPSPESLGTLIRSAVEALRRGIRWDRGTILNLLV